MSMTLHHSQVREPELLDVVDEAWAQDKLPNDGSTPKAKRESCTTATDCVRPAW